MLELSEMLAGSTGLEPAASGVTGRRSNQLNYDPEFLTSCLLTSYLPTCYWLISDWAVQDSNL